jgi:uncharacterized protein YbjT (DUF2867 family)
MILVTGASGTVGKEVLREVARAQKKTGAEFRAMYRSANDAAQAPEGTDTVVADFADKASLAAAFRGVESVYLVCSPVRELVELEGNAIEACEAAGVRRLVLNSALGAGEWPKSFPSWHRKVEDKLKSTGLAYCILRPNTFTQNVLTYYAPSVRAQGAFYGAYGNAPVSYVDIRDIALVAAKALRGGESDGQTYELNGPEALSCEQVAQKISQHTGTHTRYVDLPPQALHKGMTDQGMPEWQATALVELQEYYTTGKGGNIDTTLQRLLGGPPRTLDQFLVEFASDFRGQAAKA